MAGEKMDRAKGALKYCLSKLNKQDWFNIIRFSSDVERFEKQIPARADFEITEAMLSYFIKKVHAAGKQKC